MLFNETVKWKCLGRFFQEAEKELYVKELAREIEIGSGSASRACKELKKEGMLKSQEKGKALFYSLKNDEPLVRRLKSAWFISKLMKFRDCWEDAENQSVVLYGSRASGEFISRSDVDILVISNVKKIDIEKRFEKLKEKFGYKLTLVVLSLAEWSKMAKNRDRFYIEVLTNHVLLFGSSLVVG